ncbi:YhgN family NAAT transporter [Flocculibacter collagenilyticus]|uniref:YhgN family NAAT transporter n=1 Tax=Flocculibacter collagenilyticus TaxID=2744479 RepID=UPI0018F4FE86|nr:YhgN family NAAT transporter [Flocculibacter collagenilyticus]
MDIITAAVTLFLIMDPLGNLPIVISALKNVEKSRRNIVLIRELILSLLIMLMFLFAGESILDFLNLRQESVSIAGGIILFLIAIKMIFPSPGGVIGVKEGEEPFLVPIAVPMIAGPSILAALLLLANQDPNRMMDWSLALIGAWLISAVILMFSGALHRMLGERGLTALERLMGMILVMIAVQMLLDGIGVYFKL